MPIDSTPGIGAERHAGRRPNRRTGFMPHDQLHVAHAHLNYRPDIDGLRGIAVVSVLLYHLRLASFSGGFVGVDIFFVISGYLIGSLIIREAGAGTFRLLGFYARRARRILPALVAMICVVLQLGWLWLLPSEFAASARSAVFALLSVSNIYFYDTLSYFEPLAANQPLLHTWSLGIEEQFYLAFPLLVLSLLKLGGRALVIGLATAAAVSFAWGCHQVVWHKEADFFLADSRGWELLLGTLVSALPVGRRLPSILRNILGLMGLAMICWSIQAYSLFTPFPGAAALVPCAGTACIIAAGHSGPCLTGKLLSLSAINFLGRISYSLYIWHWPIIFFQVTHPFLPGSPVLGDRLAVILYSLGVAAISWRFVEQPFRGTHTSMQAAKTLLAAAAALTAMIAVSSLVVMNGGFPHRFKPVALQYASYLDYGQAHFRPGKCFITTPYTFADFDQAECLTARPAEKNDLLVGDSHAAQLWYGLSTLMPGVHVMQATASACPPTPDPPAADGPSCTGLMQMIFHTYLPSHHIDRLLIAARWDIADIPGLEQTLAIANAMNIPATVFGPMIEYDQKLPRLLAWQAQANPATSATAHQSRNNALDALLSGITRRHGANYVSVFSLLCDPVACPTLDADGHVLQFDTDHLTREGSRLLIHRALAAGLLGEK